MIEDNLRLITDAGTDTRFNLGLAARNGQRTWIEPFCLFRRDDETGAVQLHAGRTKVIVCLERHRLRDVRVDPQVRPDASGPYRRTGSYRVRRFRRRVREVPVRGLS